jgi:hypothetical protein
MALLEHATVCQITRTAQQPQPDDANPNTAESMVKRAPYIANHQHQAFSAGAVQRVEVLQGVLKTFAFVVAVSGGCSSQPA